MFDVADYDGDGLLRIEDFHRIFVANDPNDALDVISSDGNEG